MNNKLWALILKDLKLFAADRKAMIISFAVPIMIASLMSLVMGGSGSSGPQSIPVLVVDKDHSAVSAALMENLKEGKTVEPTTATETEALDSVKRGKFSLAIIIPEGFGKAGVAATSGGEQPELVIANDPSHSIDLQAVRGLLMQVVSKTLYSQAFGASAQEDRLPFKLTVKPQEASTDNEASTSGMANIFAGMAIQGILFWAIDAGMSVLRDKRLGIWKRLRAAPVSGGVLLAGRGLSAAIIGLFELFVVLAFGIVVFHFKIEGSAVGLLLVCVATSLMAAGFGLFVAALGRSEQQSRGLSMLAVLMMSMLGGAWFPAWMMPKWMQTAGLAIPTRYAIDGVNLMTWRGGSLATIWPSVGALLGFAVVFSGIAIARFRWDEA